MSGFNLVLQFIQTQYLSHYELIQKISRHVFILSVAECRPWRSHWKGEVEIEETDCAIHSDIWRGQNCRLKLGSL